MKCEGPSLKINGTHCSDCGENCEVCNDIGECTSCKKGFELLSNNTCETVVELVPEFLHSEYANIFKFDFKTEAINYVDKFSKTPKDYLRFVVQGLQDNDFSFKLVDISESHFHVQFFFSGNVLAGTRINLEITRHPWMHTNTTRQLVKFSFTAAVAKNFIYCGATQIYNASKFMKRNFLREKIRLF